MPKDRKRKNMLIIACIMLFAILFTLVPSFSFSVTAARRNTGSVAEEYVRYQSRLQNIEKITDLEENGFRLLEDQVFAMPLQKVPEDTPEEAVDEVWFYAALDKQYHRLAVFLADDNGQILYKTDQLEANYCYPGELRQPIEKLASVSFQDVDNDSDTDIILIAQCHNDRGDYQEKSYKVGDVLFQENGSFYRDYRISDKINRFDMNKNPACILNFVRDGRSTEFLYTAETYGELLSHNFRVIEEQSYTRNFEKLGKMKVVPGVYRMAEYDVFMNSNQKCDSEPYQYHILSGTDHRGHRYRTLHPEGAPPVRTHCSGLRRDGTDDGTDVFWQLGRTQPDVLLRSLHTGAELRTYHRLRCLLHLSGSPGNRCRCYLRRDPDYVHPPDRCTLLSGHQQHTGRRGTPPV